MEIAEKADLVIAILDSTKELSQEDLEILSLIQNKKAIILLNKTDLNPILKKEDPRLLQASKHILKVSVLKEIGIEALYEKITELFQLNEIYLDNEIIITNVRHKNLIEKAIEKVKKTKMVIEEKVPSDIIAIPIKEILEELGKITGETVSEDIINEIFAKFCLGK